MNTTISIYTDGACSGNPGVGGYAAIIKLGPHEKEVVGNSVDTTNNKMELQAVISGLKALNRQVDNVVVFTDSTYVSNMFTVIRNGVRFIDLYKANGWRNSTNKPVANKELLMELSDLTSTKAKKISFVHIKGHSDNVFNNRCDRLAKEQAQLAKVAKMAEQAL